MHRNSSHRIEIIATQANDRITFSPTINKKETVMKPLIKIILITITLLLIGCSQSNRDIQNEITVTGSGKLVSREISLADFDQIEAGLHFDLNIRQGATPKVILTSDDNFIDYIQVEQVEKTIRFDFIPGYAYDTHGITLRAEVFLPELSRLDLEGSSHANLDRYQSKGKIEATLSGASTLTGNLQVKFAKLNAYGSSVVQLTGSGTNLALETCGANLVDLDAFATERATIEISCNSRANVDVSDQLQIEASQYAQVIYDGNPTITAFNLNESASVRPK
jgi:hypothetical protein